MKYIPISGLVKPEKEGWYHVEYLNDGHETHKKYSLYFDGEKWLNYHQFDFSHWFKRIDDESTPPAAPSSAGDNGAIANEFLQWAKDSDLFYDFCSERGYAPESLPASRLGEAGEAVELLEWAWQYGWKYDSEISGYPWFDGKTRATSSDLYQLFLTHKSKDV